MAWISSSGAARLSTYPAAPAASSCRMYPLSSWTVRASTLTGGHSSRSRSVACDPVSPGIETSMTTTSGRSLGTCSQAACPSAASPTTAIPAWALIRALSPSRTTAWSSTRNTRSSAIADLPVPARERDPDDDRGAPPGGGLDRQRPAHQGRPLPHPEHAQPVIGHRGRLGVEPPPVVLDDRGDLPGGALEDHVHPAGAGVLEHVRQGLLDHPVQGRLDRGGQAVAVQA